MQLLKMMSRAFFAVILLFVVYYTEVQSDINTRNTALDIYKNLFKVKRKDHISAIEHLLLMDNEEKQYKLIKTMIKTITQTLKQAVKNLDKSGYKTSDGFPENVDTKEGLLVLLSEYPIIVPVPFHHSMGLKPYSVTSLSDVPFFLVIGFGTTLSLVLENTALMTDIVVRFPFIAKREIQHQTDETKLLFKNARDICRGSGVYDSDNEIILYSLGQELGLDPINEDYSNPFHERPTQVFESSEDRKKRHDEEKRKKKKLKKTKNSKKNEL